MCHMSGVSHIRCVCHTSGMSHVRGVCHTVGMSHIRCVTPACLCQGRGSGKTLKGVMDRTVFFTGIFWWDPFQRLFCTHRDVSALHPGIQRGWESLVLNCRCQTDAQGVTVLVGVSSDFSSEE